ncbi:MAG: hypothetical protein LQ349_005509 [Xanthoria aureola]|nr:MAG: hypothetical protein LQ349_005509 [Xanthoria aureola]
MHPTRALYARSVWKGPHIVPLPIIRPKPGEPVKPIKTMARAATILPNFVGLKFQVHNGKIYNDVTITEDMVGHKLGEFSPRVQQQHRPPTFANCESSLESPLVVIHGFAGTPCLWNGTKSRSERIASISTEGPANIHRRRLFEDMNLKAALSHSAIYPSLPNNPP